MLSGGTASDVLATHAADAEQYHDCMINHNALVDVINGAE